MRAALLALALTALAAWWPPTDAHAQAFVGEFAQEQFGRMGPAGLALDTINGVTYLYVADDTHGRIYKFNATTGARIAVWGETGSGDLQFNRPFGVAVDPVSHDLYVAERGNNRIQRITSNGVFVAKWGVLGTEPGQFYAPVGVATDATGHVYVTDYGNERVQKFRVLSATDVRHVTSWGGAGTKIGQFSGPFGITRDPAGNIWVADTRNHRLQKFDPNGGFLGAYGTFGPGNGQFLTPSWVAFDRTGAYYVTETNSDPQNPAAPDIQNQRVQKFSATGTFLMKWGNLGESGGQFRFPLSIVIDPTDHAYVSDYYNTRVQKFNLAAAPGAPTGPPPPPPPPPTAASAARFVNLSSRLSTVDGDDTRAFIAGFVVSGTAPKQMLIRAIGPGLAGFGVGGAVANPRLSVFSGGQIVAANDDWIDTPALQAAATRVGAFNLAAGSGDAAMLVTLPPGAYSAQVGTNGGQGVALVEVYDVESAQTTARLINLSTRGFVGTDDAVLVAGFVVSGTTPKRVLVRGVGPALGGFGVTGALTDSVLRIHSGSTVVAQNDNWETTQLVAGGPVPAAAVEIAASARTAGAFALPPGGRDAALVVTLPPGIYSAIVSGAGNSIGAGLVEVYELP